MVYYTRGDLNKKVVLRYFIYTIQWVGFMIENAIVFGLLTVGALIALCCRRNDRAANVIGTFSCVVALMIKLCFLLGGDLFSGCFQLPVILIGSAAALYSPGYMEKHGIHRMNLYWFLFNIMLASMLAVTMLAKGFAFLAAWEIMGLASFALVALEWKKESVRYASWVYLLACEAGGLLLIWVLAADNAHDVVPQYAVQIAILIAFGLKAGLPLLHVWLPEAHPAAPAPVSAVMSGALIPLGFYGMFIWIGQGVLSATWLGWVLFVAGVCGMTLGILWGSAQRDLKRLLAYSSVENIGIITMALGLAVLGNSSGNKPMMIFALVGALLHVINHSLLKGTLFLGAGSVYKSMHSLDMDKMGGLVKKLPRTGMIFTFSAMGISGLPPFCGFSGELLIYLAAFNGIAAGSGWVFAASTAAAVALALTGGTAAAAFAKTVSAVFSGESRTAEAVNAAPEQENMVAPQMFLSMLAAAMTISAPWIAAGPLAAAAAVPSTYRTMIFYPLFYNAVFAVMLVLLTAALLLIRWKILSRKKTVSVTWDCGYAEPTARMQYTATAFIQPVNDLFNAVLRQKKQLVKPDGIFPGKASLEVEVPDGGSRWIWDPVFKAGSYLSEKVKHLQSGFLHMYILIMVLAVLLMLGWSFISGKKSDVPVGPAVNNVEAVSK